MKYNEFIHDLKFVARSGGDINRTNDEVTAFLIRMSNVVGKTLWRKRAWSWLTDTFEKTVSANSEIITLDSTVGAIIAMKIQGQVGRVSPIEPKEWIDWVHDPDNNTGEVARYIKLGRDSSDNFRFQIVKKNSEAITLDGFVKKRFTPWTAADITNQTDLSANAFPLETQDAYFSGVLAKLLKTLGKSVEAAEELREFKFLLDELAEDDKKDPDEDETSKPPARVRWANRKRGGSTVV